MTVQESSPNRAPFPGQTWTALLIPAVIGGAVSLILALALSRLGVSVWLRGLGSGMAADVLRDVLASRTVKLTGLMLYGAHFVPVTMFAPGAETPIPIPSWAHLIPVLPLIVGGYVTVLLGRPPIGARVWLGAVVAVPYTLALVLLSGFFTVKFNLLLASITVAPAWPTALVLLPLWSGVLGTVGGAVVGSD